MAAATILTVLLAEPRASQGCDGLEEEHKGGSSMFLKRLFAHVRQNHALRNGIGSLFLFILLVGCGGPNPVTIATPTPTAALPTLTWTTFDLHLPQAALNAPVVGPLSDDTILHVII